jgi:hypothetical protein
MKALTLNFSRQRLRQQRRRDWVIVLLSVVLLVVVLTEIRQIRQQHKAITIESSPKPTRSQVETQFSEPRQQRQLQSMVQSLNLPWYELLLALEQIKQSHPEVFLTAVMPDATNKQIILRGQTKTLDNLLAFVDALNQHPAFRSALPLSQQQVVPKADGMQFTLKLEWRHG